MKLASYIHNNAPSFGLVTEQGIVDLSMLAEDLKAFIAGGLDESEALAVASKCNDYIAVDDVEFLPVIPNPGAIFCMGMNTHSHVEEIAKVSGDHRAPQKPSLFMRMPRSIVGHNQALEKPNGSPLFDYEGEIAIIIGKHGRHIPQEEALDYIGGYSCFNDGSVRDYQLHSHMFTSGKNFPRSGSFGPYMVTTGAADKPEDLTLTTRLNGEVMQQLTYDDLVYNFKEIISYVSEFTELLPGDVVVTGSAAGSALFSQPQKWLQVGDVIEVDVPCVGTLSNTIVMADGMNQAPVTRSDEKEVFLEAITFAKNR